MNYLYMFVYDYKTLPCLPCLYPGFVFIISQLIAVVYTRVCTLLPTCSTLDKKGWEPVMYMPATVLVVSAVGAPNTELWYQLLLEHLLI